MKCFRYLPFFALPLMAQPATPPGSVSIPLISPASAVIDPNKVVLQVGDIKITAKQLDDIIDIYPANSQVYYRGPARQQFADLLVRTLVLAGEARKRKLEETEKFKEQARFGESNLLAQTLGQQLTKDLKVDDAMLRKYFEEHRCDYQTWRARHILVRAAGSPLPLRPGAKDLSDADALARAQDLRKRLAGGTDFAELARTDSDDTTSGANGGDLGQIRHGQVVPSLEEAVCKMNAGDLGEPLKTPFGYHVVKLESKEAKSLEDVKAELEQRLRPEAAKKLIDDWIAKTKVVKDPEYYAPVQPNDITMPAPKKP